LRILYNLRALTLGMVIALVAALSSVFKTRAALQLENLALRHQLGVLHRSVKKPKLTPLDRLLWAWLCGVWADWRSALIVVKPETVIAWHRKGFRLFWTWRVRRGQPGRPSVPKNVRDLIRLMSRANPTWGTPRIHGELLKLGMNIGETSVSKYLVRHRKPPSQTWGTFLENHVKNLVSVDFFTVPTLRFQVLYVGVTTHPTAEWTAQQLRDAFPWDSAPRYLLRDRDRTAARAALDLWHRFARGSADTFSLRQLRQCAYLFELVRFYQYIVATPISVGPRGVGHHYLHRRLNFKHPSRLVAIAHRQHFNTAALQCVKQR
jgi:hypothetical protein